MGFFFSKIVRNLLILYIIFSGTQYFLSWKAYTISPREFKTIASKAQGGSNSASTVNKLSADLRKTYGLSIVAEPLWTALTLGSLNLKAYFLHASLTEYAAVFGSPYPTNGRAGLHWTNSTCTVLTGSVSRMPDSINLANKEVFSAGGNFRHGQFESYIYNFAEDTYMACYGRGLLPVSGVWAGIGALSNGEPLGFAHLAFYYAQASYNQAMLGVSKTYNHYKNKATGGKSEL